MFRDYRSTVDDIRKIAKRTEGLREILAQNGIDLRDVNSIYRAEMKEAMKLKDPFCKMRLLAEMVWYHQKRPYFNVYPVIEKKLIEINDEIKLEELFLPYPTIEIRTQGTTFLLHDAGNVFAFVVEFGGGRYSEFTMAKRGHVKDIVTAEYQHITTDWPLKTTEESARQLTKEIRVNCAIIACGVCLLAKDPAIVVPVILNRHRRDNMTLEEIHQYKEKAIKATDKTGFDVGRDMQFRQSSCHYRNGCFAKYYVGKNHEAYPDKCDLEKAPIIKWRSGSVVNASNTPKVPTGFKDVAETNTVDVDL